MEKHKWTLYLDPLTSIGFASIKILMDLHLDLADIE